MTYSLWASGPALKGASTSWMLLTVPIVLMGIFRYQFLSDPSIRKKQFYVYDVLRKYIIHNLQLKRIMKTYTLLNILDEKADYPKQ